MAVRVDASDVVGDGGVARRRAQRQRRVRAAATRRQRRRTRRAAPTASRRLTLATKLGFGDVEALLRAVSESELAARRETRSSFRYLGQVRKINFCFTFSFLIVRFALTERYWQSLLNPVSKPTPAQSASAKCSGGRRRHIAIVDGCGGGDK